jgi:excinuclease UvrABC ATPase subunit
MMAGVASACEECEGKRFTPEVLTYKLRGKDISEVLAMPVTEAREFFTRPAANGQARAILDRLADVGLGYLGPGAGHDGGRVVFTGTPAGLVAHGDSLTAQHLRTYLAVPAAG